jgi:hypothetical protein
LLSRLGWRVDGGIDEWAVSSWARPTTSVLRIAGGRGNIPRDSPTADEVLLARAALQARPR